MVTTTLITSKAPAKRWEKGANLCAKLCAGVW